MRLSLRRSRADAFVPMSLDQKEEKWGGESEG